MGTVELSKLPGCDFCSEVAGFDGKTTMGPWAYMCVRHFKSVGQTVEGLHTTLSLVRS